MTLQRRQFLRLAIGSGLVPAFSSIAFAEGYPARPVRVLVPYAPAGPADILARFTAQKLSEQFGKSFYVENVAGAGGNIGMGQGARAAADGYTLLVVPPNIIVNPAMYVTVPYDPYKDFDPVTVAVSAATVLSIHPSLPVQSVGELERFSVDVNRNSKGFPKARKSDSGCFDSNSEVARWRRDTRRTSGRGAVALVEDGESRREAARVLGLGASTAIRWIERWATTGSVAALPGTGHCRSPLEAHRQWLLDLVAAEPDLTLEEIRARLKSERRLKTGTTSVWRFYERHDITFKKNSARRRTGSS